MRFACMGFLGNEFEKKRTRARARTRMNVWQWVDKWIRIDATGTTEWEDDYVNGIIILLNDSLYFCFHSKVEAKEQATKTIRHYVFLFKLKKKNVWRDANSRSSDEVLLNFTLSIV